MGEGCAFTLCSPEGGVFTAKRLRVKGGRGG